LDMTGGWQPNIACTRRRSPTREAPLVMRGR
jgi:hypothetical protein